ncbi:hypothetical protein HK405_007661 [Cladochytrium tenue]|nr:hypothetical protein HK405_007661 [Cladochytrium tenue]
MADGGLVDAAAAAALDTLTASVKDADGAAILSGASNSPLAVSGSLVGIDPRLTRHLLGVVSDSLRLVSAGSGVGGRLERVTDPSRSPS